MYNKLPLDFIGITEKFGSRVDPINSSKTYHYGIDLGWHKYQGEPIYAINNSKVIYVGTDNSLGNYIVFSYDKDNNTIIYRYLHLKEKPSLKIGDKVVRGQKIGNMGTSGYSTGVHLHFEYWICPKGYKYNYQDRSKYAKNPLDYCYAFDNQEISKTNVNDVIKVVGTSLVTKRNNNSNQLEVVKEQLRCRVNPTTSSTILGYIDLGIYNYYEEQENDGYKWYKISSDKWISNADNSLKIYKKEEQENNIDLTTYNKFICPKTDYYYIYLKKDEKIYFSK